jgi:transcription factor SPN1
LYNDIFGDDDDDDDLSDEDVASRPRARLAFPPRDEDVETAIRATRGEDEDDDEDQDRDDQDRDEDPDRDEDDYVPAGGVAKAPKVKKAKKHVEDGEDEDRDEDEGDKRARKKQKKEKRRARTPEEPLENIVQMTEEEGELTSPPFSQQLTSEKRKRLYEKIDAIGKKPKQARKKKRGDDDEAVDSYHDDVCIRLRERMIVAAERDRALNDQKRPATSKLAMLEEVMGILRKWV